MSVDGRRPRRKSDSMARGADSDRLTSTVTLHVVALAAEHRGRHVLASEGGPESSTLARKSIITKPDSISGPLGIFFLGVKECSRRKWTGVLVDPNFDEKGKV